MISTHVQELLRKAVAHQRAGRLEEAAACFARACAQAPSDALCGMGHAYVLAQLGRHEEAEARLRPLAMRQPKHAELWDLWAVVLLRCGKVAESIRASQGAVAANPKFVRAWTNLALAFLNFGRPRESLAAQDKALALDRNCAAAHHGRAMALQHLHRIPEAVQAYGEALRRDPQNLETRSYRLFALHYLGGVTREALWAEHQAYAKLLPAPAFAKASAGRRPESDRRLRIGFVSPDLRDHSVSYFLEPLLTHLRREDFEVVLYHDHFRVDAVSERLKAQAAEWRHIVGWSHAAVATQIRSDRIDVLFDLAGHTGLNRLPVFAERAAPVQISYLGYPDTTGVPAMDYRLVDAVTDPAPEADALSSERLVRFAPVLWSYMPPREAPQTAAAQERQEVAFGSCNNLSKVNDETLQGWAGVLAAVPGSRLRVKADGLEHAELAAELRRRSTAAGIDPERMELLPRAAALADHLAFYRTVDVALDTYPYNGTTTTCEALWMGVPVVSLSGDRHCARVGASLLQAVGRPEWVARSWEQYADIAGRLAARRPGRDEVRRGLAGSCLMDHAGQAGRFGAAVRQCWSERVGGTASIAA